MVTTIKITCDGVFIQTNSNRIHTDDERIVTDSSINVINGTSQRLINGHANGSNKISNGGIIKRSISVHNIDAAPQSLPNLPIANSQPALVSPYLVKTLSRIKKTTAPTANQVGINGFNSTSSNALSSAATTKSIHKVIRIDKNGKCSTQRTPITSNARQWDGCTNKKNGAVNTGSAVRRRNTFKNYLIECKENIVRRLSSPNPLIG